MEELVDNIGGLEEWLFYSSVLFENLLRTLNSIYYEVNANAASELITHNNLVNKELKLQKFLQEVH